MTYDTWKATNPADSEPREELFTAEEIREMELDVTFRELGIDDRSHPLTPDEVRQLLVAGRDHAAKLRRLYRHIDDLDQGLGEGHIAESELTATKLIEELKQIFRGKR